MKYLSIVLVSFLTLGFLSSATAQRNRLSDDHEKFFRMGAKAGVNINKITGQSYKDRFNYNFQAGGFAQINFSRTIGLQPEINFVQTSEEFATDASNVYDDLFREGSQHKAKLNYLEVPLLVNVNLGPSKRVKLQLGPAYGKLLGQTVEELNNKSKIFKNADWSGIGGLWLQLPVINLSARYKVGFSDINNIDNRDTWRNQAIQIGIGVTL